MESIPRIDVLTLFHNGRDLVDPYMDAIARTSVPITLHLLDNGSTDGSAEALAARLPELDFPVRMHRSMHNHGFAGGMNRLARQVDGEFLFVLNSDARPAADCIERLVGRAQSDPRIGICEARQTPQEHPKAVDRETGETTWCSLAAALIRRDAFEELGGFDEKLYFMYCEDIDLSWKMWLRDWKCIYVPEAVVEHRDGAHRNDESHPPIRRPWAHYFSFRNSLFIYHRFRRLRERRLLPAFLLKRFVSRRYSFLSKALFAIAFVDHIRYIPYLLRTRRTWGGRDHPWIQLNETSLAE
jgi:GT2 family glycosyltransferase